MVNKTKQKLIFHFKDIIPKIPRSVYLVIYILLSYLLLEIDDGKFLDCLYSFIFVLYCIFFTQKLNILFVNIKIMLKQINYLL